MKKISLLSFLFICISILQAKSQQTLVWEHPHHKIATGWWIFKKPPEVQEGKYTVFSVTLQSNGHIANDTGIKKQLFFQIKHPEEQKEWHITNASKANAFAKFTCHCVDAGQNAVQKIDLKFSYQKSQWWVRGSGNVLGHNSGKSYSFHFEDVPARTADE